MHARFRRAWRLQIEWVLKPRLNFDVRWGKRVGSFVSHGTLTPWAERGDAGNNGLIDTIIDCFYKKWIMPSREPSRIPRYSWHNCGNECNWGIKPHFVCWIFVPIRLNEIRQRICKRINSSKTQICCYNCKKRLVLRKYQFVKHGSRNNNYDSMEKSKLNAP